MKQSKTYIYTLGCPVAVKHLTAGKETIKYIKPVWNTKRFAIIPTRHTHQKGLLHLPTQRVLIYGRMKQLKAIAIELDDHEYAAFNLDNLPTSIRQELMDYIFRRVL